MTAAEYRAQLQREIDAMLGDRRPGELRTIPGPRVDHVRYLTERIEQLETANETLADLVLEQRAQMDDAAASIAATRQLVGGRG